MDQKSNVAAKTIKLLEKNREKCHDIGFGNSFLYITLKV